MRFSEKAATAAGSSVARWHRWILGLAWCAALCGVAADPARGEANLVPNPRFESGDGDSPARWTLSGGEGRWVSWERGGAKQRGLRVTGRGEDSATWRSSALPDLTAGGSYWLRFRARREPGASGGTAFAGVGSVHRDFPLSDDAREYSFVFSVPDGERDPVVRLGQWHVRGGVVFEEVGLVPVRAVHERFASVAGGEVELGAGESVHGDVYRFEVDLSGMGANAVRGVVTNRVGFNSNRWLFDRDSVLVLRHELGAVPWQDGVLRLGINHHVRGTLVIEASREGSAWQELGRLDGDRRGGEMKIPEAWFPSSRVWVRLTAREGDAAFQVDTYTFTARVQGTGLEADGGTEFRDAEGRTTRRASFLEGPAFGRALGFGAEAGWADLWWCSGGWKVGRQTPGPGAAEAERARGRIELRLAKGEYEPVQCVLRPRDEATLLAVGVESMLDPAGRASTLSVRFAEVAYVPVTRPTDATCVPGLYPDPLPPVRGPLVLKGGENQPLWITVHAPREAVTGEHRGELVLKTSRGETRIPWVVEVYDFEMPRETHLRSALGLGMGEIARYHRLTTRADQVVVFEKYLQNFAEHRISPYSFYDHAPMEVSFPGEGANRRARVDFTAFDRAAERWLSEGGFSTFQLRLQGMGGGTFHSRHLGRIAGFEEGSAEHTRLFADYLGQVEAHLRERGWLSKAFTYWFDEPDPKDYDFVVAGMKRLKHAAPGIRRMLTEQPEPALFGHVEIWCGLTPEWTPERVRERREAGEAVWWYICTAPKAPYVTEFIDHPGTELRLWPWQSWQYGVEGILVWATIYWTSPLAYPEPRVQDPWRDPMSWVTGYGFAVGHRAPWGNGDGRFLYPPRRDPNASTDPNLDGPIDSVRWENLRDGMEDYEYLWLLRREVERLAAGKGETAEVRAARELLTVPAAISADLTHFTRDPAPILDHRDRVARAIVRLRGSSVDR